MMASRPCPRDLAHLTQLMTEWKQPVSDTVTFTFTQPVRPALVRVMQDTPVVLNDGTIVIVRAGTLLQIAEPDGPPQAVNIERK